MENKFDQHIKQSLENFEAQYNSADWADMQNRLSKAKVGKSSTIGKALMMVASVAVVAGAVYYFSASNSENSQLDNTIVATQNSVQSEVKENQIQQEEVKGQQPVIGNQLLVDNNKLNKEKNSVNINSAEQTLTTSKKTETQSVNNVAENKTQQQESAPSTINPQPLTVSASFHTDINKVCEGLAVQFAADNADPSYSYRWNFGDGKSSAEMNPKHTYAEAGVYVVKLRITSNDKKTDEQKNTITVLSSPAVRMDYALAEYNSKTVNFEADADNSSTSLTMGVTEWKWDFGDKQSSAEQNPVHTYARKGNYAVSLSAKNNSGCTTIVKKDVKVEISLLAPSGFSPNGDGTNDTWIPKALLVGDKEFTLTIYDGTGRVVYVMNDKNNPWDGQNTKMGDTFTWKALVKDKNGEESYQGLITIAK